MRPLAGFAIYKAMQSRFGVSHQYPIHLRPVALTVIITSKTHPPLVTVKFHKFAKCA